MWIEGACVLGAGLGSQDFLHIKDCFTHPIPNPRPPTVFMLDLLQHITVSSTEPDFLQE